MKNDLKTKIKTVTETEVTPNHSVQSIEKKRYIFGEIEFIPDRKQLLMNDGSIELTPRMAQLMLLLIEARPNMVSKETLLTELWPGQIVSEWSLARLISDTRKIIEDDGKRQATIQTIRGRGFSFTVNVDEIFSTEQNYQDNDNETFTSQKTQSFNFSPKQILLSILLLSIALTITMATVYYNKSPTHPHNTKEQSISGLAISELAIDQQPNTINHLDKNHLIQEIQNIQKYLKLTKTSFIAQVQRRNELGKLLLARHPEAKGMSWEKLFHQYYSTLNHNELFIFQQIRAMTSGPLYQGNKSIWQTLENHPELLGQIPLFDQLYNHLTIWLNKYEYVFLTRKDMCLLYIGVEDAVPFPSEIDNKVYIWLKKHSPNKALIN